MKNIVLAIIFVAVFFGGFFVRGEFIDLETPHYNKYHSVVVKNESKGAIGNIKIANWDFDVSEGEEELECPSTSAYRVFTVTIRDREGGEK